MFSFLNPFLLWGLAAISLPILIHLLLRQRPQPRPWAAMRWLQSALHAAQRKYKITNLILLIMRCLIIALIALAISRPHLGIWRQGGDLVLIIDVSASMGSDAHGNGALESAKKILQEQKFTQDRVVVVSVGHTIQVLSNGSAAKALRSLQQLKADDLPGGLSRLLEDDNLDAINGILQPDSTVLCVSDFRQDDGSTLVKTLANSVHSINRWQVGSDSENTFVSALPEFPDFVAGQAQHLRIQLRGAAQDVQMSINDGSLSPIPAQDPLMISLPPLQAGMHMLTIQFNDSGLAYDNQLRLGIHVRAAVPCLLVQQRFGYLAAASSAAHQQLAYSNVDPARFHSEPLIENGIIIIDSNIGFQERLWKWVDNGGVVFMWSDQFFAETQHQKYNTTIQASDRRIDGLLQLGSDYQHNNDSSSGTNTNEFDRAMAALQFNDISGLTLGDGAESLLQCTNTSITSANSTCIIARSSIGDGYIIVASADLRNNDLFWTQGIVPFFWRHILRDTSARAQLPLVLESGSLATKDLTLIDAQQEEHIFAAGSRIMLKPGIVRSTTADHDGGKQVIILPHSNEGILQLPDHQDIARDIQRALPQNIGTDWTLWVLILLVILALSESLFAGRAGRAYGT